MASPAPPQVRSREQQMRDLRDGEHEDEVVEQLQIGGVLLLVAAAKVSAHRGATLAIRAAGPAFAVSEDFGGWGVQARLADA